VTVTVKRLARGHQFTDRRDPIRPLVVEVAKDAQARLTARLRVAAGRVLGDARLLWAIVGIVAIERIIAELPVFLPAGADAFQFILSGQLALTHPGSIYPNSAALIAAGHPWTITWPPPQILLAIPFALLPQPAGVWIWVVTDGVLAATGLFWLYRAIDLRGKSLLPLYCLVILCFSPLFEDVRLGQRGGPLLFLAGAAMVTVRSHPALAGALTGIGTSIKFYPAALAMAVKPRQWMRFSGALAGVATTVLAVSFIPFGSPIQYITGVLLPVAKGSAGTTRDCFQNSTPLLFSRLLGGASFSELNSSGVWTSVTLVPWHLTSAAAVLTYVTIAAVVGSAAWAGWRSGWAQPYSMSLAFSLGALVPGDVYTYQFIALMPLTLVLFMKAVEQRRWWIVGVVAGAVWIFVSSPCTLVVPGLWTIAGLAVFGAAVAGAARFKEPTVRG